jgi:hypothetical protein
MVGFEVGGFFDMEQKVGSWIWRKRGRVRARAGHAGV